MTSPIPAFPLTYKLSWPVVITAANTVMSGAVPKTIATFASDPYGTVGNNPQRQVWFANGRWWVSYTDSRYSYFDSTADKGVTWKGATILRDFTAGQARQYKDSIWWDEATSYVYYTACGNSNMGAMYWQRGTCNADGTITWGGTVQLSDTPASTYKSYPMTCKDTNGYPWVSFIYYPVDRYYPAAAKASATNGSTWNDGVAVDTSLATSVGLPPVVLPLASGKMLCAYISGDNYFFKTYDGANWDANATTVTTTCNGYVFVANNGNTVYFLYGDTLGDIKLRKYVHGTGLSAVETVAVTPSLFRLSLTYDSTNDICYIFYTTDGQYLNVIIRASDGTYSPSYRLFDEESNVSMESLTSSLNVQNANEIMVCYQRGTANPWTVQALVLQTSPSNVIFTAGANGSRVDEIRIKSLGTNVQTAVRIFVNNGGPAANDSLLYDKTIAATTLTQNAEETEVIIRPDFLKLPPLYRLYASIGTAVAAGIKITVNGGDY